MNSTLRRAATMCFGLLAIGGSVAAEGPRASGSSTGDGSTPFTGLARAPEASLFIGAATTAIPIDVPPGRQRLTPSLALSYSSSAGPSAYGYGWDLPLGTIRRSSKHGVLSCSDAIHRNDFVLALPSGSVECNLDENSGRCAAIVEEGFVRIEYFAADNRWEARDKSGLHYIFGATGAEREGRDVSVGFNASSCAYTSAWGLSQVIDPNGNHLQITYVPKDTGGLLYPQDIRYGGNLRANTPHLFAVRFEWGPRAPEGDQVVSGMGGFAATLTRLLAMIRVSYTPAGSPAQLVRSYKLWYDFDAQGSVGGPRLGRRSLLTAVTVFDQNGQALSNLSGGSASTTFFYQNYPGSDAVANPEGFGFERSSASQRAAKPDVVNGSQFGRWTQTAGGHTGARRDILDMNSDGIADLVDTQRCSGANPKWDVFPGTGDGYASARDWWAPANICALRWGNYDDNGNSDTTVDTVDLDGDGVPDLVDATTRPWRVYYGYVTADRGGGFHAVPREWSAPLTSIRVTRGATNLRVWRDSQVWTWGNGSEDRQDLLDFNGDGLLDLVQTAAPAADGTHGPMTVWFNTGSGFAENGTMFSTSAVLRYTANDGTQIVGIYDVNGDGLPDQLVAATADWWYVLLNTGHGFDRVEIWDIPAGCNVGGLRRVANNGANDHDVILDFFDINGDGLPDIVNARGFDASTYPNWAVCLNRGGGFAPDRLWQAPAGRIRNFGPGGAQGNQAADRTLDDVFDIDGDGLVDFVSFYDPTTIAISHSARGAWCASGDGATCGAGAHAAPNPNGGRPDLLLQMENGTGGSTFLSYRPSTQWNNSDSAGIARLPFVLWTLTDIERDDGLCNDDGSFCIGGSSHSLHTTITYGGGLYEPAAREFRGFGSVEQYDGDGNAMDFFFFQDAVRKGKVWTTETFAAGTRDPLVYTVNEWTCADPPGAGGRQSDCPHVLDGAQRRWVRLSETHRFDVPHANQFAAQTFTINHTWDDYGNITEFERGGTGTASVTTLTDYAANDGTYIVDKPTHVLVYAPGGAFEEKWFAYDNGAYGSVAAGNLTTEYRWLDQVPTGGMPASVTCPQGEGKCVTTQMAYDVHGNLTTITDANQHRSTTAYDPDTHIYPYTVTNPMKQRIATGYDPRCGKLLWRTIPYLVGEAGDLLPGPNAQEQTTYEYDTFCRPRRVTLPDETSPHFEYLYFLGASRFATDVRLRTVEPASPLGFIQRDDFYDALGRHLQTQHDGMVDGTATGVAEGTVAFDQRGNPLRAYVPFPILPEHPSSAKRYAEPPTGTGFVATEYDALNRSTQVTNPDGATRRTQEYSVARDADGVWRWQVTAKDECYNSGGACPGGKVTSWHDAFGRNVEKAVYDGDRFVSRIGYIYDAFGRVTQTLQSSTATGWNERTAISTSYDSLGRKVKVVDPDTGTPEEPGSWVYGYDLVGNLLRQDDPAENQYVAFRYDAADRLQDKIVVTFTFPPPTPTPTGLLGGLAGACQKKTPTPITRFQTTKYTYDTYPTPLGSQTAPPGDPAGRYSLGRLTQVEDPSGSTLFQSYDVRGRVRQMTKVIEDEVNGTLAAAATFKTDYDVADHLIRITYPDQEVVVYGYDAAGQVKSLQNTAATPTRYLTNITYDLFGRPRVISHGNATSDTRTYGDRAQNYRLTSIVTKQGRTTRLNLTYPSYTATGLVTALVDGASAAVTNTATFTYNGLGQLSGVSGPNFPSSMYGAPASPTNCATATRGYCYDALGNVCAKEGSVLAYSATQPHTLAAINGTTVPTPDLNGNRTGKAPQPNVPAQVYSYDAENRLIGITSANGNVDLRYDYTGRQVLKVDPDRTVRYFSKLAQAEWSDGAGYLTKHYFANGVRVATQRVAGMQYAALAADGTVQLARATLDRPMLLVWLRPDIVPGVGICLVGAGLWLWLAPWRRRPVVGIAVRHGHVIGVLIAFLVGTLPWPLAVAPRTAAAATTNPVYHYHLDHLGSTQVVTNGAGGVVQQIRYRPYGEIRYRSGTAVSDYAFTGYEHDAASDLDYAGARWYDPSTGMFLTHDPARQFASPYTYTNWDPVNRTDPNGAFIGELVAAVIIAAVLSAAVNTVVAAARGLPLNEVGHAAAAGAITGAVGVGLGVVVGGIGIGAAALADTVPENVGVADASRALGEVAYRSAFSTVAANTAGQTAAVAGAPPGAVLGISIVAGYGASYGYDAWFSDYHPEITMAEGEGGIENVSSVATHNNMTRVAARDAGFSGSDAGHISAANLAEDNDMWNNQDHFGFGAQRAFRNYSREATAALRSGGPHSSQFLVAAGRASHHLQDQYALGHLIPGTHTFAGRAGAPLRSVIHQIFGGEATFLGPQYNATRTFFAGMRGLDVL